MTREEGEQISRIILTVFEHEDTVDPRTIAAMFKIIGNMHRFPWEEKELKGCNEDIRVVL